VISDCASLDETGDREDRQDADGEPTAEAAKKYR
jgi:hypothetical protein